MEKKIVSRIMLTLLVIGMLPLTFNIQQVKAEPVIGAVGDRESFIWSRPQDSSLKSAPESFYTSVVDIIHPQPGQFAHYFLQQYISPSGIGWWNTSYNEYVQPHIINTTHRVEDPFENGTYWCTVDTTNRWVTDTDPDSWWNQTWYGDWIETNVTVGSVIDWWWADATIFGSETLYVVGRDVDCWVANASSEGSYSFLYYDKLSGLLVKSEDFVFGGELSWEYTLNATNIISEPRTWTVDDDGPADFSSIQEAVNNASSGDIIFVHSGTYYENVVVNKTVSLIGENKNNTIVDGNALGTVVVVTANNVNITEFTIRNGWGEWQCGIVLSTVENCNVFENIIADNELGIGLGYSNNSRISDNYITHNEGGIFLMVSSYNIFRDNKMVENTGGFSVYMGENLTDFINDVDSSNTIDGKPIYYWVNKRNMTVPLNAGYVALVNCTLITVDKLTQKQVVQIIYTTNSTITNSIVYLSLQYSSDNIILRNNLSHSGHGIYLLASSNNVISENNITANSMFGIILWGANNNNCITRNNIAGNGNGGIYIAFSSNNTITGNNIANNWSGIKFMGGTNNHVYHNNFINNTNHASTDSPNTWDNGFEGNYWSDYEEKYPDAQELNGSGIWDTPYYIKWNNQDNFPLMEPWSPKPSPVETTQELIETIETWNLHKGTENSLKNKLKVAIHMLDMGKEDGAIRKLTAFTNRAEMLREKALTNEQADYLTSEAQRIIDVING